MAGDFKASFRYYGEANALFRALKDTFGVAYSYCGIANSMRMNGDFRGSLRFFTKARENYKRIGDKVSYAYTLWGEGTALQMLGRNREALKDFEEARSLFRETKDRRGLIYCLISIGELDFKKDPKKGMRAFSTASEARSPQPQVEARYAKSLIRPEGRAGAIPSILRRRWT
ncbi:MAG: tetratricopeptide repeat protein [Deltaproteobacteria bacterium]|nr:tetratricopeptide repeat protein [Deltaproteobacteria bacterium]